jgi:hypothetical protein
MLTGIKRLIGWILGPPFALLIVLLVRFFERRLRFETRRDAAWRSHSDPATLPVSEDSPTLHYYS